MNILVISHYGLYSDFGNSFVHDQAKAYVSIGNKVKACIFIPFGKKCNNSRFISSFDENYVDGVDVTYIRYISLSSFGEKIGLNTLFAKLSFKIHSNRILNKFNTNIVHAHTLGFDSELGAYVGKKCSCKCIVTTHGSDTTDLFLEKKFSKLKKYADKVDIIIAVSNKLKQMLLDSEVNTPINVVINGFNISNVNYDKCAVQNINDSTIIINQTSNLKESKNVDVTIKAVKLLSNRIDNIRFDIVGDGREKAFLKGLVNELSLDKHVEFYGVLSNADAIKKMSEASFFVMPSKNEGFGIVYLEAMASGCITIGVKNEGISDFIIDGVNGFLVEPNNYSEICERILWCIENKEDAITIANKGRRDALSCTWKNNVKEIISIIHNHEEQ